MMQIKRIFITLIIFVLPVLLQAQDKENGISIVSSPPGAEVFLNGDLSVAGISPVTFYQSLEGQYKLVIQKEGYETYKSRKYFIPDNPQSYTISLKPKTQFKALARSFIIPGWGQAYCGQGFKGGLFFASSVTAMIIFLNRDANFRDLRDNYEDILADYEAADGDYDELNRLFPLLQSAKKSAFDAESDKRISFGVLAGVWALNLLDILFHFPYQHDDSSVNSLTFQPDVENGGGKIVLSHRF